MVAFKWRYKHLHASLAFAIWLTRSLTFTLQPFQRVSTPGILGKIVCALGSRRSGFEFCLDVSFIWQIFFKWLLFFSLAFQDATSPGFLSSSLTLSFQSPLQFLLTFQTSKHQVRNSALDSFSFSSVLIVGLEYILSHCIALHADDLQVCTSNWGLSPS